jgi:hypothetical protein
VAFIVSIVGVVRDAGRRVAIAGLILSALELLGLCALFGRSLCG